MPTYWHKPAYTESDHDPVTKGILPGAMPPGIYCEDEDGYRELLWKTPARADLALLNMFTGQPEEDRPLGWMSHTLGGIRIRVATPAEAEILRAADTNSPAPEPKPAEQSHEEACAELVRNREREARALVLEMGRAYRAAPTSATKRPFRGANRKAKRAAKAKARRRA